MKSLSLYGTAATLLMSLFTLNINQAHATSLNLEQTIALAQKNDFFNQQVSQRSNALSAQHVAVGAWQDPRASLNLMNLPIDTFSLSQEPMTQMSVGIAQMLPRGDSLLINQAKVDVQQQELVWQHAARQSLIALQVQELWLDAVAAEKAIELINSNKALFEQLLEVTKASYTNAIGRIRQQDVIRAELELIQLEERLANEQQKLGSSRARLVSLLQDNLSVFNDTEFDFSSMPALTLWQHHAFKSHQVLVEILQRHPSIKMLLSQQQMLEKNVDLANEAYKPQWGVNASYAFRDSADTGMSRADFFSVGVSVDLPVFTEKRQDQSLNAAKYQVEAAKTQIQLQLKNLIGESRSLYSALQTLAERQIRFDTKLIAQSSEQAEAALTAYTHDDGAFTDVVWARVNVLNIQLASLNVDIQALKTVAKLNALLSPDLGQLKEKLQ
ncbi:Heavy metal RND efflux outer membrane protein,CzcC family [Pseudoalteromonas luteoviolacea B = ATCC 29581]|nr:Heavy metal RND efflux outer membrane protein,CzcC family [Pseudoalteromonas luteoviolacea B = ATCC 29581]